MNSTLFQETHTDQLRRIVPVEKYVCQRIVARGSFFQPIPLPLRFLYIVASLCIRLFEYVLGVSIKVENPFGELFAVDPRARRTIHTLLRDNIIKTFEQTPQLDDQPRIIGYRLELSKAKMVVGGAGGTPEEALRSALGEALERHSLSLWEDAFFIKGTFTDLKKHGAIDPCFLICTKSEKDADLHLKTQEMNWVRSFTSSDGRKRLVPAQIVYLYYRGPCSKESALLETTSNAAAAGRSRSDALRRALLEGIERDSFLVYWMSKCAPNRILLDSIKNKNIRALLDEIQECRLDVTILDVTTDLKIPTICSVLIDRFGGVAVSLTLASDFNIENAILKTLRDAVRHGVSSASRVEKSPLCDEENYTNILSIKDRRRLWSHQCMIPRIQFFISEGKEKSLKEMVKEVPKVNRSDELAYLKKILRDKGYRWYAVDVTAPAARREKIYVVKVILPDLIPVFFSERRRPIGISRLYSAPVAMGIHKKALTESELNSLPHPFL